MANIRRFVAFFGHRDVILDERSEIFRYRTHGTKMRALQFTNAQYLHKILLDEMKQMLISGKIMF